MSAFARAVLAIDEGRVQVLAELLADHPELASARTSGPPEHYFTGSTLLHHVAWNPWPGHRDHGLTGGEELVMHAQMPAIVAVLVRAGADPTDRNASGHTPLGLLFTSQLASTSGQTGPIADALVEAGVVLPTEPAAVHRALANHAAAAARYLLAKNPEWWDVRAAAGLGELDRLKVLASTAEATELGMAALHAYVLGELEVLGWVLTQSPDVNVTGVGNGTLLHRACAAGDLVWVERLLGCGADVNDRANPFRATPLDWADHAGQEATVAWLLAHVEHQLDIFQAASYDRVNRLEAILADNPEAGSEVRGIWSLDEVQPLRMAALQGRVAATQVLLRHGANPHHKGGDGQTALDEARARGLTAVLAVLEASS